MSVQLLLLRKSIYWTWVYCKITKVKTWIHSASAALLLLPSRAWESRVLHTLPSASSHRCSSPDDGQASLRGWQPTWAPSHRNSPRRRPRVQPEKNKPWKKEEMARFLCQDFWLRLWPCHELWLGTGMQDTAKKRGCLKQAECENPHVNFIVVELDYLLQSAQLHVQNNIRIL